MSLGSTLHLAILFLLWHSVCMSTTSATSQDKTVTGHDGGALTADQRAEDSSATSPTQQQARESSYECTPQGEKCTEEINLLLKSLSRIISDATRRISPNSSRQHKLQRSGVREISSALDKQWTLLSAALNQTLQRELAIPALSQDLNVSRMEILAIHSEIQDTSAELKTVFTPIFTQQLLVSAEISNALSKVIPSTIIGESLTQQQLSMEAHRNAIISANMLGNQLNLVNLIKESLTMVSHDNSNALSVKERSEEITERGEKISQQGQRGLDRLQDSIEAIVFASDQAKSNFEKSLGSLEYLDSIVTQEQMYGRALATLSGATTHLSNHPLLLASQLNLIQEQWQTFPTEVDELVLLKQINQSTEQLVHTQLMQRTVIPPPPLNREKLLEESSSIDQRIDSLVTSECFNKTVFEALSSQTNLLNSSLSMLTSSLVVLQDTLQDGDRVQQRCNFLKTNLEEMVTALLNSSSQSFNIIGRTEVEAGHTSSTLQSLTASLNQTKDLLLTSASDFGILLDEVVLLEQLATPLNDTLQETRLAFAESNNTVYDALSSVRATFEYFDQLALAIRFSNTTQRVLSFSTFTGDVDHELRSVSFHVQTEQVITDSVMVQLADTGVLTHQNTTLTVGILDGRLTAALNLFSSQLVLGNEITTVIVSRRLIPGNRYRVELTRVHNNVHLFLREERTGSVFTASGSITNTLALYLSQFSNNTKMAIGGGSNVYGTPFSAADHFTGCLGDVTINEENVNIWSLAAAASRDDPLQACPILSSSDIPRSFLKLDGGTFMKAAVNGSGEILPLEIEFRASTHNGLLLHALHRNLVSHLQISLRFGYIVVRVTSSTGRSRTLTSTQIYNDGTNHILNLSLSRSQRTLILTTDEERTTRGLQFIPTSAVNNFTEIFVGGVTQEMGAELGTSNMTGCIGFSSVVAVDPTPPLCTTGNVSETCSTCSEEPFSPACFYGNSFVAFPPLVAEEFFDFELSFKTVFPDSLVLYSGNVTQRRWFSLILQGGHLQFLFGSSSGNIALGARSPPLSDGQWHSVGLVKLQAEIRIIVNGLTSGSYPFGSHFPTGTFTPALFFGGVPSSQANVVQPGIPLDGFKGCARDLRVRGQRLDFLEGENVQDVSLGMSTDEGADVFTFNGSGFAEYDLGRFPPDFSFGFQFRSVVSTGLLMYVHSARRRNDHLAIELRGGQIGFSVSTESGGTVSDLSEEAFTDGRWHSALVGKRGGVVTLSVDGESVARTEGAPQLIRTDSSLFVGGLPSSGIRVPSTLTTVHYVGCLRTRFLHLSQLVAGVREGGGCELSP